MSVHQVSISALGPKGDGISFDSRAPLYVERALPGDLLRVRVERDGFGVDRGEILEITEPSNYRQKPPCPHFETCGNCTLQHLQNPAYRDWKQDLVVDALERQGIAPRKWLPTVFVGKNQRRRAVFSAVKSKGKVTLGYYRRRSKEIRDIPTCLVADPALLQFRESLVSHLKDLLREGKPTDLFLQILPEAVDLVITGSLGNAIEPDLAVRSAVQGILNQTAISRVSWRASEKEEPRILAKKCDPTISFGDLKVRLPPAAFLQPTWEGEKALVSAVLAGLPEKGRFADLFSGCGTFSGPILQKGSVDAYEMVPSAIAALQKSAQGHALKVFRRDLFMRPLRRDELNRYHAIVFDPPRAGCLEQALQMASSKVRTLVAVSCNPATLARDARVLCQGGYRLKTVQIIDQFLWSHHVETVAVFTK